MLVFSTIEVIKYIVDNKQNKKIEEEISNFVDKNTINYYSSKKVQ